MRRKNFNIRAHEVISNIFNEEEMRLVRADVCPLHEASEYLTIDYIKTCSEVLENCTMYLQNEENIGSALFLAKLARGAAIRSLRANSRACSLQLALHTHVYFPEYLPTLQLTYLRILANMVDIRTVERNGVLMLAAASLPGVRTDIRREFRRRGVRYDRTIVSDATLAMRLESQKGLSLLPDL